VPGPDMTQQPESPATLHASVASQAESISIEMGAIVDAE